MSNLSYIIFVAAISVCAFFASRTKQVYRLDFCHVFINENNEEERRSTTIWSDQVDWWLERFPESHCGRCGKKVECPK